MFVLCTKITKNGCKFKNCFASVRGSPPLHSFQFHLYAIHRRKNNHINAFFISASTFVPVVAKDGEVRQEYEKELQRVNAVFLICYKDIYMVSAG